MSTATSDNTRQSYTHPDYADAWEQWKTIEDTCSGTACVKKATIRYVPKLSEQTDAEYATFLMRAVFFGATKRTKDALSGLLLRRRPEMHLPSGEDEAQPLLADVTMGGVSVWQWIRMIAEASVSTGRSVTVIDYSEEALRPYFAFYQARDVLNWATSQIEGKKILSLLILHEIEEILEGLTIRKRSRYRSYRIDENGQCLTKTWADGEVQETAEEKPMMRRGKPLKRIPAVFHNASHLGCEIGEATLYDIAEINLAHFRGSASLENGRHLCGLPTPYATGVDDDKADLTLGTTTFLTCEKAEANFGFMEFTGAGLSELTKGQEEKEKQMAVLGARLLFDSKKDAESFETVRLRAASEGAALGNIAGHMSVTTTQALQWYYWWQGNQAEPTDIKATCLMSQDFVDTKMAAADITALVGAFQGNAISFEAFFHNMREGEMYPDGWDMEKEAAAIAQRPPAIQPPAPPAIKPGEEKEPGNPSEDPKPPAKKVAKNADA